MWKIQFKRQNVRGTDGTYDGTDGTCPWDRRDTHQGMSRQNSLCLLVFVFPHFGGCQACRSAFVKLLVKFDLEFDLKFEISDGKNLVKFGGKTFLPARKARKIRGEFQGKFRSKFRRKVRKLRFKCRDFFSGNFVQQQDGANPFARLVPMFEGATIRVRASLLSGLGQGHSGADQPTTVHSLLEGITEVPPPLLQLRQRLDLKTILTTPTPHISKKYAPKICSPCAPPEARR